MLTQTKVLMIEFPPQTASRTIEWGAKDGRTPGKMTTQTGYLHTGNGYTLPYDLRLSEGDADYEPGFYLFPAGAISNSSKGPRFSPGDSPSRLVSVQDAIADLQGLLTRIRPPVSPSPIRAGAAQS